MPPAPPMAAPLAAPDFPPRIAPSAAPAPAPIAIFLASSPLVASATRLIGASAVILAFFFFLETRAKEPIVPLGLFRNRIYAVSIAAVFLAAFGFFAAIVFLPVLARITPRDAE